MRSSLGCGFATAQCGKALPFRWFSNQLTNEAAPRACLRRSLRRTNHPSPVSRRLTALCCGKAAHLPTRLRRVVLTAHCFLTTAFCFPDLASLSLLPFYGAPEASSRLPDP